VRVLVAGGSGEVRRLVGDVVRDLGHDPVSADDGKRATATAARS
jgi:hypothetical protein